MSDFIFKCKQHAIHRPRGSDKYNYSEVHVVRGDIILSGQKVMITTLGIHVHEKKLIRQLKPNLYNKTTTTFYVFIMLIY